MRTWRQNNQDAGGAGDFSYNATTMAYGSMIAMAVISPTKIARLGLHGRERCVPVAPETMSEGVGW